MEAGEFSPIDLQNPFPNGEGSVHIWQGDKDLAVPESLQPTALHCTTTPMDKDKLP